MTIKIEYSDISKIESRDDLAKLVQEKLKEPVFDQQKNVLNGASLLEDGVELPDDDSEESLALEESPEVANLSFVDEQVKAITDEVFLLILNKQGKEGLADEIKNIAEEKAGQELKFTKDALKFLKEINISTKREEIV